MQIHLNVIDSGGATADHMVYECDDDAKYLLLLQFVRHLLAGPHAAYGEVTGVRTTFEDGHSLEYTTGR